MGQPQRDQEEACWTIQQLLEYVERWVAKVVPGGQDRYKVTDVPDARTLRYYVSSGVVDRPGARRGTASLYGRRHLLQVLAVKRLQAQHLSLRKIAQVLRGKSSEQLEELLGRKLGAVELVKAAPATVAGERAEAGDYQAGGAGERWRRISVAAGVELHLAEGLALTPAARRAAMDAIQRVLGREPT